MRLRLVILAAIGAILAPVAPAEVPRYRLPRTVLPEHYDLLVHTSLADDFRFYGWVRILVRCVEATDKVTLHARNLTVDGEAVRVTELARDRPVGVRTVQDMAADDFLVVTLNEPLEAGRTYAIELPFAAELGTDVTGYYRSSYQRPGGGEPVWLAVTQFQAVYARQAFPCFDEPDLKATFNVSLGHHRQYRALSNMPLVRSESVPGQPDWVIDHFDRSVRMSSYLVVYTINDYESLNSSAGGVQIRSWTQRDAVGQLAYATEIAPRVVRYYESYFGLPFPLPKIDFVTIPNMLFAAMENWGVITFVESALQFSETEGTLDDKHFVTSVVSHEVGHMWFGNLVTMRWWTDLWLNEGFSRYSEFLVVDHLHPEWRTLEHIPIEDALEIFKFDALNSSHPVSVTIGHPDEIPQLFDSISYKKGSAIIRMMHLFLGEESYRKGLTAYLKQFAFGNAEQDDLWRALSAQSQLNVKAIMDTWTLQTGYPVLTVQRQYGRRRATVTQERFVYDRTLSTNGSCWAVPVTWTSSANGTRTEPPKWLHCKDGSLKLTRLPSSRSWLLVNRELSALVKVQYDRSNYRLLSNQLNSDAYDAIHVINRAQLLDDAFDFAWVQRQDYDVALALACYLRREAEYIPWKAALNNINRLEQIVSQTQHASLFNSWVRHLLLPIYQRLSPFGGGSSATADRQLAQDKLKKQIVGLACAQKVSDCVARSLQLFERWRSNDATGPNPIPAELRPTVYCTAVRHGSSDDWAFLWARYRATDVGTEKHTIADALGCTGNRTLIVQLLELSRNESSPLRLEDTTVIFDRIVAEGGVGVDLAREHFFTHIDQLHDYVNPETFESRLASHIKALAARVSSGEELQRLETLVQTKATILAGASLAVAQALETAKVNRQWRDGEPFNDLIVHLHALQKTGFDGARLLSGRRHRGATGLRRR